MKKFRDIRSTTDHGGGRTKPEPTGQYFQNPTSSDGQVQSGQSDAAKSRKTVTRSSPSRSAQRCARIDCGDLSRINSFSPDCYWFPTASAESPHFGAHQALSLGVTETETDSGRPAAFDSSLSFPAAAPL